MPTTGLCMMEVRYREKNYPDAVPLLHQCLVAAFKVWMSDKTGVSRQAFKTIIHLSFLKTKGKNKSTDAQAVNARISEMSLEP